MATYLTLVERVVMALTTPAIGAGASAIRERYEPRAHTINNANPYQGITITEGHGKYPVIFEPLQNVQTSLLNLQGYLIYRFHPVPRVFSTV